MARFCPNCGTEVDETAVFCPTCGQPIDQEAEAEIPPAPAWPDPPERNDRADDQPGRPAEPTDAEPWTNSDDAQPARADEPTRVEPAPPPAAAPPPTSTAAQPPAESGNRRQPQSVSLPVTWPVTLSAWLIGGGTVVAAVGVVVGLFRGPINPIDLLLVLLLLAIAVTVFFAASVPAIPHLRMATMVVVLIGLGIAIDRIGFGAAGIGELLLFLGTAAAAMGCILLELGRDQPLGGPTR
ncbi:MAG: zinc-ribbon domain-containing protein [Chloroflexi bacterium]|nr:zinc-ribbon domain-containing protein [Chloroflexota bacterium]